MKLKITIAAILITGASVVQAAMYETVIFNEEVDLVGFTSDGNLRNTTISNTHYNRAPTFIQAQFNCETRTVNVLGETGDATKAASLNHYTDTAPVTKRHPYFKIMGRVCQG